MRKFAGALIVVMLALLVVSAVTLFGLYRATQQTPPFYRRVIQPSAEQSTGGEQFERQALTLHNQVRHPGTWEGRFSEDEINGWLAAVLPEKFPQAIARGISDPRIAFADDTVQLAARYQRGSASTVVSLVAHVHLTDEPNEVAVQISNVRAGSLPVPLAKVLQEITHRAAQAGLPLRWTEAAGQPVALVRLPLDAKEANAPRRILERLEFRSRELLVAGHTEQAHDAAELAVAADQPEGDAATRAESETRQR